ncbi:MAG: hypothetical protein GX338_04710 [Firmicutes bacterium]|jgi:hydrogenase maturation factor|nr:hypothetical protein [Bacillota bacterium]
MDSLDTAVRAYDDLLELAGVTDTDDTQLILRKRLSQRRDLTLVRLAGTFYLVIACDSDGGIGPKPNDTVPAPPELLGRFAARVPLMEMVASGARPLVLVDTLSVEMEPTGRQIIEGVRIEAHLAGMVGENVVTGSTEDNVPTTATGVGVTAIGIAEERQLRQGKSEPGDVIVCVGIPKSAPHDTVTIDDPEIADIPTAISISLIPHVRDILPVGSKGIHHEALQMAESAHLELELSPECRLDTAKSAGPSTCILASLPEASLSEFQDAISKPVSVVGGLIRPAQITWRLSCP